MYFWNSIWYEVEFFHVFSAHACVFLLLAFVIPKCFRVCIGITTFPCRITTCSNLIRSGISYCNASNNFKQIPSPAVFCVQLTESYRRRLHIPWCSERKHCPVKGCIQLFLLSLRKPCSNWKTVSTHFYCKNGWGCNCNNSLLIDATREDYMWAAECFKSDLYYKSLIFKGKKMLVPPWINFFNSPLFVTVF